MNPPSLHNKLQKRRDSNSLRSLKKLEGIDFSSNDYLGFAQSKELQKNIESSYQATAKPIGSTGSRLLTGNSCFAEEVEIGLAKFFKADSSLLFNSGYAANTGLISCIAHREDTILYDQYCHASIRDGIKLSNATSYGFKHNDLGDLKKKLALASGNIYVIIESIYSMDGDFAPLKEVEKLCNEHHAYLIVDEAHSTGIYGENGEGLCVQEGIKTFARVHTFGKAMGVHGACVIGAAILKEYLVNFSRPFIYTTAMPLHSLVCIEEVRKYLPQANKERAQLYQNISHFNSLMAVTGNSPIKTVLVPGNKEVKAVANSLQAQGFLVFPILSPTVPAGEERIRICLHSYNTKEQIESLIKSIKTTP